MKTAFITGISGQDGAYLARDLRQRGYRVVGGVRRSSERSLWRLTALGVKDVEIVDFELFDHHATTALIRELQPDEMYNLAAMSFVGTAFKQPFSTMEMNQTAVLHMLEAIRLYSPHTRFYQASTSEMFGKVQETPQTETTPFYPRSPYGIAKLGAYWLVRNYREAFSIHASNGILFNHESPLRGDEFVTQKIVKHVKDHYGEILELGNVEARRDWGHAEDYVKAMHLMLQQDTPDDYVIATGKTTSVREFVDKAFWVGRKIRLTWDELGAKRKGKYHVIISPELYRPAEVEVLCGDPTKAINTLGWLPRHDVDSLIEDMFRFTY